jgi:hypothetical protein
MRAALTPAADSLRTAPFVVAMNDASRVFVWRGRISIITAVRADPRL